MAIIHGDMHKGGSSSKAVTPHVAMCLWPSRRRQSSSMHCHFEANLYISTLPQFLLSRILISARRFIPTKPPRLCYREHAAYVHRQPVPASHSWQPTSPLADTKTPCTTRPRPTRRHTRSTIYQSPTTLPRTFHRTRTSPLPLVRMLPSEENLVLA
jgi:hypothetical protein